MHVVLQLIYVPNYLRFTLGLVCVIFWTSLVIYIASFPCSPLCMLKSEVRWWGGGCYAFTRDSSHGGGGGGGYMYSGSIPSSTFGLLLVECRLGVDPLVYATLHLPSMEKISISQLQKASDIAKEFGHDSIVECLGQVLKSCLFVSRGGEGSEKNGEERPAFIDETKQFLEQLDKGANPEGGFRGQDSELITVGGVTTTLKLQT